MSQLAETPTTQSHKPSTLSVSPWGHFDLTRDEFVLSTPFAPKPWKNILWNETYNTQPTQSSAGISYQRDEDGHITLLNWSGEKYFYLKNLDTGEIFCPTIFPYGDKSFDSYQHRIGLHYSTTEITQFGLEVTITHSADHTQPREYFEVSLKNTREVSHTWRIVFFSDIDLSVKGSKFSAADRFVSHTTPDQRRLTIKNTSADNGARIAFLECSQPFAGKTYNRENFTGTYGSLARPDALVEAWLTAEGSIENAVITGYVDCPIEPDTTCDLFYTLGISNPDGECTSKMPHTTRDTIRQSKAQQHQRLQKTYSALSVETPDESFDLFINTWIKHQLNYCAYWNRGWEKGFRDSNQDAWAFTLLDPARAKKMILDCLPYQYPDGRTVRKWAPIDRDAYNDGGTWLIFATHAYLAESDDLETLQFEAPFFESDETGSLYEHLRRGVDYLWDNRGDRGLCLMPYGDWNDRLTGIGKGGKGQSVWTTMALAESLRKMKAIAEYSGQQADAADYAERAETITEILRKEAWNGAWYSRAFTDAGDPVGAPDCAEGSIYLLPQAWSIIAGIATEPQRPQLIQAVQEKLQTAHGFRLLTPPYQKYDPSIGHLSATQPGRLENGGNYCHGTMFMTYAFCMADQRELGMAALKSIFPINPKNPPANSRQEPFSLTNSYCAPEAGDASGRSHFSWRSGTAGWALRSAIEGVMGTVATLDGLVVASRPPVEAWDEARMHRMFRGKKIEIKWTRTGTESRSLNGVPIENQPLSPDRLDQQENCLEITF